MDNRKEIQMAIDVFFSSVCSGWRHNMIQYVKGSKYAYESMFEGGLLEDLYWQIRLFFSFGAPSHMLSRYCADFMDSGLPPAYLDEIFYRICTNTVSFKRSHILQPERKRCIVCRQMRACRYEMIPHKNRENPDTFGVVYQFPLRFSSRCRYPVGAMCYRKVQSALAFFQSINELDEQQNLQDVFDAFGDFQDSFLDDKV